MLPDAQANAQGVTAPTPPWRGFHHVAVVTADLDATIAFYEGVLGMRVGEVIQRNALGTSVRHCFIRPGVGETWGMHFFEQPDARLTEPPVALEDRLASAAAGLQHIAFALPDEAAGIALRERLAEHAVQMTPIGDVGGVRNTLFLDNNGMLLEAAWPKV